MSKFTTLFVASALLTAAAHAQCLQPATGTSIIGPTFVKWSSTSSYASTFDAEDEGITNPPIAFTAFAAFPMAGALGNLDQMWINSNGDIYLSDSTAALLEPLGGSSFGTNTILEMRGQIAGGLPRIIPLGGDHEGSDVLGNAWDIKVDQTIPGQVRITFTDMARFANVTDQFSFDCTLFSSGAVQYWSGPGFPDLTSRYVGLSIGNLVGTTTSPSLDLTAGADSGTEGMLYENFASAGSWDLGTKSLLITPNGSGGYTSIVLCEPASHTKYGAGCYNYLSSIAQLFPDQATTKAALDGNRMHLAPTPLGYTASWVAGGATSYIAPTGGATTLVFPIANGAVSFSPSVAFPVPGGTAPTLSVQENGILTASPLTNNASDTTPALADFSSATAPALAFYCFRDFTLSEAGSGPVQREEVVVGPDTILCVTWNAVEALPVGANPTTFQFQLNLTTGAVDYVWVNWDSGTSTSDTLIGAKLAGGTATPVSTTLSTGLPLAFIKTGFSSVYQLFPDQTVCKAALDGNAMDFTPTGTGYTATWVAGGGASYIAPTGGATTLTFPISNGNVQITPSASFPVPGGSVPTLTVSENGILTAAAAVNNGTDTTPTGTDMVGTAAPNLGFYSWRDFDLAEAGSGPVKTEEFVVGPHTILTVTWQAVEALPAGANPTTFQFQCNLNTGTVRIVWVTWDAGGSTSDTLVGASLAGSGVDPFSITLSTGLPQVIKPPLGAVTMAASPAPIFTIGNSSVPMVWQIDNLVDFAPALPGVYLGVLVFSVNPPIGGPTGLDFTLLGVDAPGCNLLVGSLDVILTFTSFSSSYPFPFTVPQPLSPGTTFYSQALNLIGPNSLPNGQNGFGLIVGNGVKSRFDLF